VAKDIRQQTTVTQRERERERERQRERQRQRGKATAEASKAERAKHNAESAPTTHSAGKGESQKGARTRAGILDNAAREFAEFGFQGARLLAIAKASKCPTALIHHYFSDKETLYAAVVERASLEVTRDVGVVLLSLRSAGSDARSAGVSLTGEPLRNVVHGIASVLSGFLERHGPTLKMLENEQGNNGPFLNAAKLLFESTVTELESMQNARILARDWHPREVCLATLAMLLFPVTSRTFYLGLEGSAGGGARSADQRSRAIATMVMSLIERG
jgi:AcrR family transcriptional regulator